jgi:hypothetical protein
VSEETGEVPAGRRSRWRILAGIAIAVTVACVGVLAFAQVRDGRGSTDATGRYVPSDVADPSDLVGVWWLRGRDSLDGRLLAIGVGEFAMFDDFCKAEGTWRASSSGLVATFYTDGGSGQCDGLIEASDAWFADISWFATKDDRVELLNVSGETVLTLEPAPDLPAEELDTSGRYPRAEPVAPLPPEVQVPTSEQLVDVRWLPLDSAGGLGGSANGDGDEADQAFAEFADDNYWEGSDGCNGQAGSWALHPGTGEWLATSGASTDKGCKNYPVAEEITGSAAVGIDGDELVFFDADGTEIGRYASG